jgi:soluble lytic murein transglycosylase
MMTKTYFSLVLLLLALSACSLTTPEPQEVIYVTATPEVTATPDLPPTETPLPTVSPTPTIAPEIVLQVADNYLLNGHYESAVLAYQDLLQQDTPDAVSASAAFGMGQAALREGLFTDAVSGLTTFIERHPQDPRYAQAYFLRGDAYLGLSEWAAAAADFEQYLALRPGLIDSYARERLGDAYLALGRLNDALMSYDHAVRANRTIIPLVALREKIARIYINAGAPEQAVIQYDAILSVAQNTAYRATIEFLAAQTLMDLGDLENGLARMRTVFQNYSGTQQAYHASNILIEHDQPVSNLEVGRERYLYGDYEGAIDALTSYTTERILSVVPAELHLMLGRSYRELGSTEASVVAFQTIIDQYPQDPAFGEALLEQGRTKFLAGDINGAIAQYLSIADRFPYLSDAAEALWRAGYLYGTNDDPTRSRELFERLATEYPTSTQALSGLQLAASAAYKLGEMARAEQLFARLAATATGDEQASAYLWVGRLALLRGDNATAENALRLAVTSAPDSYFAARAQDLTTGQAPFTPPAAYQFHFDEAAQIAEAEAWLREAFALEQAGDLWPLSAELAADPRLIRGQELWAVAAYPEARTEFSALMDEHMTDGLASYQLAIFLRSIGAYQPSVIAASYIIRQAGVATLEAPSYIARMRYPIYYLDAVQEVTDERGIDPLLMFSLIRHESLFDTYATAAAGEKGLTQVIPSTAEYIATQLQWPNYQHSVLFRPYAGVAFGAFYLDEQLRRFDGHVIAALSGYNAGPGRAIDWLALSGGDPDLFISAITIDSTRLYVQRIYSAYNIYRALYGGGG